MHAFKLWEKAKVHGKEKNPHSDTLKTYKLPRLDSNPGPEDQNFSCNHAYRIGFCPLS